MLAFAHIDERADDIAHHVMQEGVRAQYKVDAAAAAFDLERIERTYRALRLTLGGAKRREVVLADEQACSGAHRFDIERQVKPADIARRERGPHRSVEQHISIDARPR